VNTIAKLVDVDTHDVLAARKLASCSACLRIPAMFPMRTRHNAARARVCVCDTLQALSEERASAIEKLQLQLDLANEKVAVLTAELSHLEQEGRQVSNTMHCDTGLQEHTSPRSIARPAHNMVQLNAGVNSTLELNGSVLMWLPLLPTKLCGFVLAL